MTPVVVGLHNFSKDDVRGGGLRNFSKDNAGVMQ
jgi:hypothetical protein